MGVIGLLVLRLIHSIGWGLIEFLALSPQRRGVAHAISPDVRFGHPDLRSLDGNFASPSGLRSVSNAA
ncbi:MAG: hypothetical protein ACO37F_07925, partial [Pirellulales bacterium]